MRHREGLLSPAVSLLVAAVICLPAAGQDSKGKLGPKVVSALRSVAKGTCPADLMGPLLLDQCEKQLGVMQSRLSELGEIKSADFKGIESLPNGVEAEAYRVRFQNGAMLWLASVGPNGKFIVLWSPG